MHLYTYGVLIRLELIMKKFFCLIFIISIVFLCCSCIDIYSFPLDGVYVSEDKTMIINLMPECSEAYGCCGKLVNEDGSVTEISFESFHGDFIIWKHDIQSGDDNAPKVFLKGECRPKKEKLILYVEDGNKIVLIKENSDDT